MNSDVELVERSRRRDAEAFGTLVTRHQQLVFGVALAKCGDPALAEDVAQEAFVAAWRDLDRLRDAEQIGSWVAGIARNLAASAARTRARRERAFGDAGTEVPAPPTPRDEALEREDRELLQRALADIPDVQREALVLFYLEGRSIAQIARTLAISDDAVKQRLSRGRGALRDSVADRVESVLARTRLRPAFGAGVIALLSTAGAKRATAGKVVLVMSAKKLVILVATVLAIAGGAVWFGTRDRGAHEAAAAAPPATMPATAAQGTPGKVHVEKLADKVARELLLAKIKDAEARRNEATATPASQHAATPRPTLPGGDLDKDYIRAAVKQIIPMLTECYEHGLLRDPKLAGKVVVDFTIEGEQDVGGLVGESTIDATHSDLPDPQVRECIQETMYALQIDPPPNGGMIEVKYPFEFRPASP
jgi:RNA polymerase sigma factor (sigma-70 family)